MASPKCAGCCFNLRSMVLDVSSAGPLDALHSTGSEFPYHLVHVIQGCYPAMVIPTGEAFEPLDTFFHPDHRRSGMKCEEDLRHR